MLAGLPAGETHDRFWAEAASYFRSGRVEIAPYPHNRASDRRLGLSVIGRPSPAVSNHCGSILNQVKTISPDTSQDKVRVLARYPLADAP
jgi:hypothetical protein